MKFVFVVFLSLSILGCSSGSSLNYLELADNQTAQIRKQELIDFEKARVKQELSDWN